MKKALKEMARSLLYLLARVTPKANFAVLRGPSAYEDNLIAIHQALLSRPVRFMVWIVNDPSIRPPIDLDKKIRLVKRGGFKDVFYSLSARYVFITYEHYLRKTPPNQISVNLWHGIPLKAIGKTMGQEGRSDTIMVSTSALTNKLFMEAFGISESVCAITGQARTDRMFTLTKPALWARAFPDHPIPQKLYLWLPTFRTSVHDRMRQDGDSLGNVFNCSDFSDEEFNNYLARHNAVCLVKPHPATPKQSLSDQSHIRYIDEAWLSNHRLTLYQLTGAVDCLISDISSIIIDFMLLNRPLLLLFEDIEEYECNRGFSLNPITDFLPAKVAQNFEGFMHELEAVQNGKDVYAEKRQGLKKLFFEFDDPNASERILDRVFDRGLR